MVPTIERMHRNKQITDDELQAAKDFYKYFTLGHRVGGLTARYGELAGAGGTPPGQQIDPVNWRGDVRLSPDELRTMYSGLWASGVKAIDHAFTAHWLQRIVCEDYSVLESSPPTVADCGRAYVNVRCAKQAQALGLGIIKQGLERLAKHYGISQKRPRSA